MHAVVDVAHDRRGDLAGAVSGSVSPGGATVSIRAPFARASSMSPSTRSKFASFTEEQ